MQLESLRRHFTSLLVAFAPLLDRLRLLLADEPGGAQRDGIDQIRALTLELSEEATRRAATSSMTSTMHGRHFIWFASRPATSSSC